MAREEFQELIDKSGGLDGHAKLYVLSMMYLKADDVIEPDVSCLEPFSEHIGWVAVAWLSWISTNLMFGGVYSQASEMSNN